MKRSWFRIYFLALLLTVFLSQGVWAKDVIQTQASTKWSGISVDLFYIKIKNDILSLRFKYNNNSKKEKKVKFYFSEFYIIDEANQKKYYALKDKDGVYLGGPKTSSSYGGIHDYNIEPESARGVWLKFPAPPEKPETITISVPGVFPFEEVEMPK